jgi:hypothetical protein
LVTNLIWGGASGYSVLHRMANSKTPDWYGVSLGPLIQARHLSKLSGSTDSIMSLSSSDFFSTCSSFRNRLAAAREWPAMVLVAPVVVVVSFEFVPGFRHALSRDSFMWESTKDSRHTIKTCFFQNISMPWIRQRWFLVLTAITCVEAFVTPGGSDRFNRSQRSSEYRKKITTWLLRAALEPPAITVDGLSCSHDGGDTWQLKDVSYVLPRGASTLILEKVGFGGVAIATNDLSFAGGHHIAGHTQRWPSWEEMARGNR